MREPAQTSLLSPEDYLEGELRSEIRHEFLNGHVYAMVGASRVHNVITGNIFGELRNHVRGGRCRAFVSDMKVHIRGSRDERFYYPDIVVSCDPADDARYHCDYPVLIVEVLSETTERADRAEKFYAYRGLVTLQEYLLVAQDNRRVECYRRRSDWDLQLCTGNESLILEAVRQTLDLDVIYEDTGL